MFDPEKTLSALSASQRIRLIELLEAGNTLPWAEIDDDLLTLRLVQPGHRREDHTTLNNWGWSVAMMAAPPETP